MSVGGGFPRAFLGQTPFHQVLGAGAGALPLPPEDAAEPAPYPAVKLLENAPHLGQPEIIQPASKQRSQILLDEPAKVAAAALTEKDSELGLETRRAFGSHLKPGNQIVRHAAAQKFPLPGARDRAFVPVHLEFEPFLQEQDDRGKHPLPGAPGPAGNGLPAVQL